MKSPPNPADSRCMHLLADAGMSNAPLLITALMAGGVVLLSLKAISAEMEYARRFQALQQQARVLREKQAERIRNLRKR